MMQYREYKYFRNDNESREVMIKKETGGCTDSLGGF